VAEELSIETAAYILPFRIHSFFISFNSLHKHCTLCTQSSFCNSRSHCFATSGPADRVFHTRLASHSARVRNKMWQSLSLSARLLVLLSRQQPYTLQSDTFWTGPYWISIITLKTCKVLEVIVQW
jgi:hypothetical protein